MTREDRTEWCLERMGDLATAAEAEAMVELLEERGYQWREEPGVGLVVEPDIDAETWFRLADEAVRRAASQERTAVQWRRAEDGAYEARVGPYRLEAWYDRQDPHDPGWAWRVTGPDGTDESGPGDSLEDAQAQAEAAIPPPERRAYRAAVYEGPDGSETVLTRPEHAHLQDRELLEAAVKEAYDAGLIGDEPHQVTEEELRQRLRIEVWVPR